MVLVFSAVGAGDAAAPPSKFFLRGDIGGDSTVGPRFMSVLIVKK